MQLKANWDNISLKHFVFEDCDSLSVNTLDKVCNLTSLDGLSDAI